MKKYLVLMLLLCIMGFFTGKYASNGEPLVGALLGTATLAIWYFGIYRSVFLRSR